MQNFINTRMFNNVVILHQHVSYVSWLHEGAANWRNTHNILSDVSVTPPEDEHVML
jgi:hypothetical protein